MKIIALYKTYDGEEFLEASIKSIYKKVSSIIIVNSNLAWDGATNNTINPLLQNKKSFDPDNKIIVLQHDTISQDAQYAFSFNYLKNFTYDYVLVIDSDEIWGAHQLDKAIKLLNGKPAYYCEMITHIKKIGYTVSPREPCKPTVFVKGGVKFTGTRGNTIAGRTSFPPDVYFHHLTLVRANLDKIKKKIITSNLADGGASKPVDINLWIKNKWDKMPYVHDYHITKGCEHYWKDIKVIKIPKEMEVLINE